MACERPSNDRSCHLLLFPRANHRDTGGLVVHSFYPIVVKYVMSSAISELPRPLMKLKWRGL